METILVDFLILGVMFFPILLAAAIISKNDPKNNWNEEELRYGIGNDKEPVPDFELEAQKQRREKVKNKVILILEILLSVSALTAAIMSHSTKAIIVVVIGTLIATGINRAIIRTANEEA